jgi:hypothetical protein
VKVDEDLLNRRISKYGLVTPTLDRNDEWSFFKKYGSKKRKDGGTKTVGVGVM